MRLTTEYLYEVTSKHDNPDDAAAALVSIINRCFEALEAERDALATFTDADTESLAAVLHEAPDSFGESYTYGDATDCIKEQYRNEARAAIAWFRSRADGRKP